MTPTNNIGISAQLCWSIGNTSRRLGIRANVTVVAGWELDNQRKMRGDLLHCFVRTSPIYAKSDEGRSLIDLNELLLCCNQEKLTYLNSSSFRIDMYRRGIRRCNWFSTKTKVSRKLRRVSLSLLVRRIPDRLLPKWATLHIGKSWINWFTIVPASFGSRLFVWVSREGTSCKSMRKNWRMD